MWLRKKEDQEKLNLLLVVGIISFLLNIGTIWLQTNLTLGFLRLLKGLFWDLPSNSVEKGEKEYFLFMVRDREISCWTEIPN